MLVPLILRHYLPWKLQVNALLLLAQNTSAFATVEVARINAIARDIERISQTINGEYSPQLLTGWEFGERKQGKQEKDCRGTRSLVLYPL